VFESGPANNNGGKRIIGRKSMRLAPGSSYILSPDRTFADRDSLPRLLRDRIGGMSEPKKKWFLATGLTATFTGWMVHTRIAHGDAIWRSLLVGSLIATAIAAAIWLCERFPKGWWK
jgi:hypothetical protein